ncbi:MAG TPA: 2OG-Fe(II) oxygenase family protein [Stellaceae bacterium]|nr:2OG-Fe(II) oxygenase family protein [Stellaceae bacterium]
MTSVSSTREAIDSLPVIDIAPFLDPRGSEAARLAVARELRRVCIDIGFFYLMGHGIPAAELDEALSRGRDFFRLPLAAKQPLTADKGPTRFGYFPLGGLSEYGKATDLKERFSLTREIIPGEPEDGCWAGLSIWPEEAVLPGFRAFFTAHIAKRAQLTRALARVFALSLDLPLDFFDAAFAHLGCVLMFNYYPKIEQQPGAATNDPSRWSFSPHTDYGAFTLLSQDDLGGLQVRNSAGEWIDVTPLPGSFVVNIGDMFAMWTNDLYKSSLHRVMNFNDSERLSLAFFTYPQGRTEIRCLPSCTSAENPPRYQPVEAEAYHRALVAAATRAGKPGISARTEERLRS